MNIIVASRKCGASLVVVAMILQTLFPSGSLYAEEVIPPDDPTPPEIVVDDIASTTPPTAPEAPGVPLIPEDIASSTISFDIASSSESITDTVATSPATSTETFDEDATENDIDILIATSSSTSTPSIETGDAIALANIVNVANTTLVNSDGYIVFSNLFDDHEGSIDFRNPASSTLTCGLAECAGEDIRLTLLNDAFIINDVMLRALSGNNLIEGGGTSTIETGDAYAGLNLINVVNTTFVDSHYILIALNAFRGINGDIIFPSLLSFLSQRGYAPVDTLLTENVADVMNNATSTADSGNNTTNGTEHSGIETGDSYSTSNVFNQINTTLAGGNNISLLFRISGTWSGQIWGVPAGFEILHGEDGSIYLSTSGSTIPSFGNLSMNATNTASITNNLDVAALSGENEITGAKTALIATGDAYAGINLMNIANANVIGRNWMLAIINIFGDFNGNIAFGRPDLWVGEQVEVASPIENGTEMTYTMTIMNNGDSDASSVVLTDVYDMAHIDVLESSLPYTVNEAGNHLWDIGDIPVGVTKTVTYTAQIKDTTPGTDITNVVSVRGVETDNDMADNTDTATVRTTTPPPASTGGGNGNPGTIQFNTAASGNAPLLNIASGATEFTALQVLRMTASSTASSTARTVAQELLVTNPHDTIISSVVMHDILRDQTGMIIRDEEFDLGDIMPHEEVTIKYDVTFGEEAIPGIYTLSTVLKKSEVSDITFTGNGEIILLPEEVIVTEESLATTTVEMTAVSSIQHTIDSFVEAIAPAVAEATPIEPQVLGTATDNTSNLIPYELMYLLSLMIPLLFLYWVMKRSLVW